MTKPKTQIEAIKIALANGETLSSLNSFKMVGSLRLGAQIFCLRKQGWIIGTVTKKTKTRYGTHCSYGEYKLNRLLTNVELWTPYIQK